jgi:hypothetical protein
MPYAFNLSFILVCKIKGANVNEPTTKVKYVAKRSNWRFSKNLSAAYNAL